MDDNGGMEFNEWFLVGIDAGFCGPILCVQHDGAPMTEAEEQDAEEGGDPCVPMVRVYESVEQRQLVEANHPPSVWRRTNGE